MLPMSVASFLDARAGDADSDEHVVQDFTEFLSGEADPRAPLLPDPDPVFRERLRGRLWRLHLIVHPPSSHESH
jgi:hypothetical protein